MKIYKILYIDQENRNRVFEEIEIYDEENMRRRFKESVLDEQLCDGTRIEYGLDENTDFRNIPMEKILEIFESDGYSVEETTTDAPIGQYEL